jgi:serine/threonine protein phosphatase PrpC
MTTSFSVKFGCGSSVGGRPYQEDRLVALNISAPDQSDKFYFAVFDGHGGSRCSQFLSTAFHQKITTHPKFNMLPIMALQEVWSKFDDDCYNEFRRIENSEGLKSLPLDGSTATVCIISENDIYVANCGDSAAFTIMPDGKTEQLTEDHGTNNLAELDRCIKAGGTLQSQFFYTPYPVPCCWLGQRQQGKPRMMPGGLLVTRAFGDFNAKLEYLNGKKGVIVHGHGSLKYLNAGKATLKYVVLASDGVWDVLSISEVSAMIDAFLAKNSAFSSSLPSSSPLSASAEGAVAAAATSGPVSSSQTGADTAVTSAGTGAGSEKKSPVKVYPDEASTNLSARTASASLNITAPDKDELLTQLAQHIVTTAVTSPKWKGLGNCFFLNLCCCFLFF